MTNLPMLPAQVPAQYVPSFAPADAGTRTAPPKLGLNAKVKAHISLLQGKIRKWGLHPSELHELCPVLHYYIAQAREDLLSDNPATCAAAFAFMQQWVNSRRGSPGLEIEFELGNDVHDIVKDKLGLIGVLHGRYSCTHCGARVPEGYMPRTHTADVSGHPVLVPAPCRACSGHNLRYSHPWTYEEPSMAERSELARRLGIEGHMDGELYVMVDGVLHRMVLEIKSNKQEDLNGTTRAVLPKPRHVTQASIYAWLIGAKYIVFLYVNKNQAQSWHEYVVPIDMTAVTAVQGKITAINESLRNKQAPIALRVCPDVRDKKARECIAVEKCFNCLPPSDFFGRS